MRKRILRTSLIVMFAVLLLLNPLVTGSVTSDWTLQLSNLSGNTVALNYDELLAMPKTIVTAELSCYGILLTSADWGGVRLSSLLEKVGIDEQALSVDFHAEDGYIAAIPLERAIQADVIVAYERDGVSLSETLRLVVPGANGNVWIAMISSIELSAVSAQVEGQSGSSFLKTAEELSSSVPVNVQNSTQAEETPTEPVRPVDESANETSAQPEEPPITEIQPSQDQQPLGKESIDLARNIGYGMVFLIIPIVAAITTYLISKLKNSNTNESKLVSQAE